MTSKSIKRNRQIAWYIAISIALLFLIDWASKNALLFWIIAIAILGIIGYLLYRRPLLREKLFSFVKQKLLFKQKPRYSAARQPIPDWIKQIAEARAGGLCENPDCPERLAHGQTLFPWYHHIDGNKNRNSPTNIAFLCRNCASRADSGGFRKETVTRWTSD